MIAAGSDVTNVYTGHITSMTDLFKDKTTFNQNIGSWDTSSVTSMTGMFRNASAFNQPIGNWDTSSVQFMVMVFRDASAFNQQIGNWDTSGVSDFGFMFVGAVAFNQPLAGWDTSSGKFMDSMFNNASAFIQDLSCWDVSSVGFYPNFAVGSGFENTPAYWPNFGNPPACSPSVSVFQRTSPTGSPGLADTATFVLRFNRAVVNVDAADFSATKGSLSVTGNGTTYTLTVTGLKPGDRTTVGFVPGQDIRDTYANALATPNQTVTYAVSNTSSDQQATGRAASIIVGDVMRRTAGALFSNRIAYRFAGQGNTQFNQLTEPGVAGWTALDSDAVIGKLRAYEEARAAAKLEGLSPEALALSDDLIDFKTAGDPLDFYVAGAWGDLNGTGIAAYDGQASTFTAGLDYLVSPDLVAGLAATYEWSRIDFAKTIDGEARKDGWRAEGYLGWALSDDLALEAWGSYGYLDNMILADGIVGRTDSHRTMLGGKLAGDLPIYGVSFSPYVSGTYTYEFFEHYTASNGSRVSAFATETSQGALGLELRGGPSASVFGLEPYIGLQSEWDWLKGDDLVLASGDIFAADDWGLTWRMGVQGVVSGFAAGTWVGAMLEGSQVQFEIMDTSFGRDQESLTASGNLSIPLW